MNNPLQKLFYATTVKTAVAMTNLIMVLPTRILKVHATSYNNHSDKPYSEKYSLGWMLCYRCECVGVCVFVCKTGGKKDTPDQQRLENKTQFCGNRCATPKHGLTVCFLSSNRYVNGLRRKLLVMLGLVYFSSLTFAFV